MFVNKNPAHLVTQSLSVAKDENESFVFKNFRETGRGEGEEEA
jgi:hypothetical protein